MSQNFVLQDLGARNKSNSSGLGKREGEDSSRITRNYSNPVDIITKRIRTDDDHRMDDSYEVNYEGSQSLLNNLSLTQTQPNSQMTPEETPPIYYMKLTLHHDVKNIISPIQRSELEKHGLYSIEISETNPSIKLGRDKFTEIFNGNINGVLTNKLSRLHCRIDCEGYDVDGGPQVILTDSSTNGTRIDGQYIGKGKRRKLAHGQVITLLSTTSGKLVLGYLVENPHVIGAQGGIGIIPSEIRIVKDPPVYEPTISPQNTLSVLFSSPLAGKDVHGNFHAMEVLDLQKEYSILTQSLRDATKSADYTTDKNGNPVVRIPQQIHVSFNFATTNTFRSMITMGCRALHFSGHGSDTHLYFEDGFAGVHPVEHEKLKMLFAAGGTSHVRLAFVSACSSSPLAQGFVASGVPHVVAVKVSTKIEDQAAIEFTKAFYLAIARGLTVQASFTIAQQAVANSPLVKDANAAASKFQLLPEGVDHEEEIFPTSESRDDQAILGRCQSQIQYQSICPDVIPAVCQGFQERTLVVYKICLDIMHRHSNEARLVTICGEEGLGKTNVAYAVAKFVSERRTFEDGVHVFSISRIASETNENCMSSRRYQDRSSPIQNRVLNKIHTLLKQKLEALGKTYRVSNPHLVSSLLVLDGCDYCLKNDDRASRFRTLLSDLLANYPRLKILATCVFSIGKGGAISGNIEKVFNLRPFSIPLSTKILLNLSPRPIFFAELKKVEGYNKMDIPKCVEKHPALLNTRGNPKKIAEIAAKLNFLQLDQLAPTQ